MPGLATRRLAGLDTEVSAIGAGCWTIGGPASNDGVPIGWDDVDPTAAYAGLVAAHEQGVTLFDTADVYGLGHSERLLGTLLRTIDRSRVVVSSKVGYYSGNGTHPYAAAQIMRRFASTLDNLGTDYLDLYAVHSSDFGADDHYLPEAVTVLADLRARGLIRAVGMRAPHVFAEEWAHGNSPHAAATARFLQLFDAIRPDVLTARYNLLSPIYRPGETDIFTFGQRHGVGICVKQALGQGLLVTARLDPDRQFSSGDHRSRDPGFRPVAVRELRQRLAPLRGLRVHSHGPGSCCRGLRRSPCPGFTDTGRVPRPRPDPHDHIQPRPSTVATRVR
ncbi:aldo/keto reductase [Nocardia sp. BMG51109]|uniref:aldo/keto reductase n=1 Tax=Nocardia sp. BMG51109 TaxID=1056816 RepID=UPI0004BC4BAE|nr:aldo/keto reductase [Nocardia sp. BMG51109]